VVDALEQGLRGIEVGREESDLPFPPTAVALARRAARRGTPLDSLLRSCAAAERVLREFILDEIDHFPTEALREVLREQEGPIDRMMGMIANEYGKELERARRSPEHRLAVRIDHLLADESSTRVEGLNYVFDAWHLGVVAKGTHAHAAIQAMGSKLDRTPLSVKRGDEIVWAWLGGREALAIADVERIVSTSVPEDIFLAIGEPRHGIDGWRLTHHEATAAFQVMLRRPRRFTKGSETLLLAAVLRDEKLSESLVQTYLRPLDQDDQGAALLNTLRAYIETGSNAASTSVALSVDRSTVQRHLRKIEERLGRVIHSCHAELAVALQVDDLLSGRAHSDDTP
jgi:hypothetical protein